ncbi:endo-1,4-beta-xylanase [Dawidia soli]|uniref:endo-1,4-beta-xylanase n=1 Tax=Dawidia soli TaxID=2782352 RepID=A0AAP2DD30_9BACT|nr:endo-1,4-beta-xylanase [Dawidia soli]MBT1689454.1 endo-1,4-beta-xylanase [Dawidia soli]
MIRSKKLWITLMAVSVLAACADESKLFFAANKPANLAQLEYLRGYDVLKSYVDRGANPNFTLGAGISVGDFTKKGVDYSMIVSNFDEVVAGWEMKHGAVVQDDGSLNLTSVSSFISTAKAANVSVYGHTLCWHANQNAGYLNRTIAPTVIPGTGGPSWDVVTSATFETDDESNFTSNAEAVRSFSTPGADGTGRALKVTNAEVRANDWNSQLFVTFSQPTAVGEKYMLSMDVRADVAAAFATQAHVVPYEYKHWDFFGQVSATTTWATFTREITITAETSGVTAIAFNLGNTATSYYFDNVTVKKLNESGGGGPTWDLMSGNDFETDSEANYTSNGEAARSFSSPGAAGTGRALKVTNAAVQANDWNSQFFFTFPQPTAVGEKYTLRLDIRADAAATFSTQAHVVPYQYKHWDFFGQISATTTWAPYVKEITITAETSGVTAIAFNLGNTATSYYFDNIAVTKYNPDGGGAQVIEKTPEQKREIIRHELDRWIAGMMEVSREYVQSWDVVNEPMDDGNPYELKTGVGRELGEDEFYWQDYLGKDYAVEAFKLAVQYGNSTDKLFINDYNLEYSLDKCKGLIQYAEYIESQGGRVDGIGTQMHISTAADKEKIVAMFELLAETGKLIKISELDIGVGVQTDKATDDHYQAQAELYKFVVEKYLEIIPVKQQYGITVWSPRDSPAGSSWRAGEPIGLWTEGYARKRAYGAFSDALK